MQIDIFIFYLFTIDIVKAGTRSHVKGRWLLSQKTKGSPRVELPGRVAQHLDVPQAGEVAAARICAPIPASCSTTTLLGLCLQPAMGMLVWSTELAGFSTG